MTFERPLKTGTVLAATVAAGYTVCTMLFAAFPEAAGGFMTALFHGLDFRPLKASGAFTFGSFVYALLVLAAWAFALGALFGWIGERIQLVEHVVPTGPIGRGRGPRSAPAAAAPKGP